MLMCGAVMLLPASSHAADPLLSGYGGPGGGEQVVLGSTTVGGGGSSSAAGDSDASDQSLAAPTAQPSAAAPATRTSAKTPAHRSSSSAAPGKGSTSSDRPAAPGAPIARAYPSRASDAGGLPLSGGDVPLGLLGLAALAGTAVGLRRLSVGADDDAASPQVSAP